MKKDLTELVFILDRSGSMSPLTADTLGGFFAIIMMPFTYSIANGIMFGIMSWVIIKVCTGKAKDVSPIMWVIFVLFALRILTLVTNFM